MNTLVAIALGSILAAPVPKDPPKQIESLEGDWVVLEIVHSGQPDETAGTVTIKGDKFMIREGNNKDIEVLAFTIDPKVNPMTIDLTPKGNNIVLKGIYKLEKDKLVICLGNSSTNRPKEFKSEDKSQTVLVVLERAKK